MKRPNVTLGSAYTGALERFRSSPWRPITSNGGIVLAWEIRSPPFWVTIEPTDAGGDVGKKGWAIFVGLDDGRPADRLPDAIQLTVAQRRAMAHAPKLLLRRVLHMMRAKTPKTAKPPVGTELGVGPADV